MRTFLVREFALTFAGDIFGRLSSPKGFEESATSRNLAAPRAWAVVGTLPLKAHGERGETRVSVRILVTNRWLDEPPAVIVTEPFVKREPDWHVNSDGTLCYVLKHQWRDRLSRLLDSTNEDISRTIDYASTWLLSATDSLVTRHAFAHTLGIDKWPHKWAFYEHAEDGVAQYRREQAAA